ncbi:AAA15 family ATPase/GTPase [Trueperella bonasi]|uniref:AAA15 family ATPase/GTPase n=1 Tax=Trueperella bonasi TaxID=312286 RepID=A0ABT9NH61_9ACTO|nr:ATP-binding protein [Trueperella bonasi]MDP9806731.1 AAA15 family ATPase/GTPase [Trueperella bonasi]
MRILSFVARNHRSFRDEFFLDMTRESLRTNIPREGESWTQHLYSVAAIFGANASGKTAIIRAFQYLASALAHSAGQWTDRPFITRDPFRLDSTSRESESFYALDFLLNIPSEVLVNSGFPAQDQADAEEYRFNYEFSVDPSGVKHEFLQMYRSSRPTVLFDREGSDVSLGGKLGRIEVSPKELVLSRVLRVNRGVLTAISEAMLDGLTIFNVGDEERDKRLSNITGQLAAGRLRFHDLVDLARIADVGVEEISVEETEVPPRVLEILKNIQALSGSDEVPVEDPEATSESSQKAIARSLRFRHRSEDLNERDYHFGLENESSGTLAWLALAVEALKVLRSGGLLCVDELDTSLHPQLAALLVSLFQNPEYNRNGSQLIFTSHDVSLLGPQSDLNLEKKQIWYVDKDTAGASELYSLDDFANIKKNSNISKQYLEGRFGAIPRLAPSIIHSLIGNFDSEDNREEFDYGQEE